MMLLWVLTGLSKLIVANAQLLNTRELDKNQVACFFCLSLANLNEGELRVNLR